MPFTLRQNTIGYSPEVALTDEQASDIGSAMEAVLNSLKFEEEWDIVVGNVFAMEREVLEVALYDMIYSDLDWHEFNELRVKLARLVQNLLSSCRSYIDHSPQSLNRLDSSRSLSGFFKKETSVAYDSSFSYRFMEALRNYAQHNGHPVHGTLFDKQRVMHPHGTVWRHIAGAKVDLSLLAKGEFKAAVLREAEQKGDTLDVIHLSREYIEKLSEVHIKTRHQLMGAELERRAIIERAQADYMAAGGSLLSMSLYEKLADGEHHKRVTVFTEPFDRLDRLRRKNGPLTNFSKQYASGEVLVASHLA